MTRQRDTSMQHSDTELLAVKKIAGEMIADHVFDVSGYTAAATPTRRDLRQKVGDRTRFVPEFAKQRIDPPPRQSQSFGRIIDRF